MPTFDDYINKLAWYASDPEKALAAIIAGAAAVCLWYAARIVRAGAGAVGRGTLAMAKYPFRARPLSSLCQAILDDLSIEEAKKVKIVCTPNGKRLKSVSLARQGEPWTDVLDLLTRREKKRILHAAIAARELEEARARSRRVKDAIDTLQHWHENDVVSLGELVPDRPARASCGERKTAWTVGTTSGEDRNE